jgi:hypothetical protein
MQNKLNIKTNKQIEIYYILWYSSAQRTENEISWLNGEKMTGPPLLDCQPNTDRRNVGAWTGTYFQWNHAEDFLNTKQSEQLRNCSGRGSRKKAPNEGLMEVFSKESKMGMEGRSWGGGESDSTWSTGARCRRVGWWMMDDEFKRPGIQQSCLDRSIASAFQ